MCGIVGVVNFSNDTVPNVTLRAMADSIAHRGPDGEGYYIDGPVGLAHRRLAIIDLSPAAHQPMMSADERYVISYNGEVYNFQELRVELEAHGYQFRSQSDSEVVLYAYAEWGSECVARLNGMFAFAIYDKLRKVVFLARDRYGIKPLYYCHTGSHVLFASEQRAILRHPAMQKRVDVEALLEYFTFQNIFTSKTFIEGLHLMRAGTHATIDCTGAPTSLQEVRYWDYQFCDPDVILSTQEYEEEVHRLFRQAVQRQLVSDVEVGAYLSGGMDSGSICKVASELLPHLKTFTCGFDLSSASGLELAFDERAASERMSYLCQTEHYEMVLKAGDMERVVPSLVSHLEEPRVGQSYPNYYAAQLASKFVKVVLSGAGGDELFAGYPWRYCRALAGSGVDGYVDEYYRYWQRLIPNKMIRKVFAPVWNDVQHVQTLDIFRDQFAGYQRDVSSPVDCVNLALYFEAKTFLHGLLVVEDKISMAHSLEARVPFLDNDLVDFAMRIPVQEKLAMIETVPRLDENESGRKTERYYNQTRDGKLILRKAMSRIIPRESVDRVKQGFSAPDQSWFRGESLQFVRRALVNDKHAPIYRYLDYETVSGLIGQHLDGEKNRRLLLWSLLNVNEWLQQFDG